MSAAISPKPALENVMERMPHRVSQNPPPFAYGEQTSPDQPNPGQPIKRTLRNARLQKHADYERAYARSRKRQSASMSWFLALPAGGSSETGIPFRARVGLTAGKALGKAHERNRIKRRMRDALRRHVELLPQGCDLILHPRRGVLTMEFAKLEAEVVRILQQARLEAARRPQEAVTP